MCYNVSGIWRGFYLPEYWGSSSCCRTQPHLSGDSRILGSIAHPQLSTSLFHSCCDVRSHTCSGLSDWTVTFELLTEPAESEMKLCTFWPRANSMGHISAKTTFHCEEFFLSLWDDNPSQNDPPNCWWGSAFWHIINNNCVICFVVHLRLYLPKFRDLVGFLRCPDMPPPPLHDELQGLTHSMLELN